MRPRTQTCIEGMKYFMHAVSLDPDHLPWLPPEIRLKIWNHAHPYPWLRCEHCDRPVMWRTCDSRLEADLQITYFVKNSKIVCNLCNAARLHGAS